MIACPRRTSVSGGYWLVLFRASCWQGHQSNLTVICNRTPFQDSSSVASSIALVLGMIVVSFLEFVMNSGEWHVPQNEQSKMTQDFSESTLSTDYSHLLQMSAIRENSTTSQGYVETHAFGVSIVGDEWPVSRFWATSALQQTRQDASSAGFVSNSVAET
jgi:hypothetical protein